MSTFTIVLSVMMGVFLSTAIAQQSELYRCPEGLVGRVYAHQEKCYRFVNTEKHWNQAQSDCQIKGGNLVHINDQATQDFVYDKAVATFGPNVNGMWIGAHDQRVKNTWEWVDGNSAQPGKSIRYHNWAPNQPSCGLLCIEHCGQMRLNDYGRWHDVQCHATFFLHEEKYRYSCMYDMGPKSTTTTTTTPAPTTVTTTITTTTVVETNDTTGNGTDMESTTFTQWPSTPPSTRDIGVAVDSPVQGAQGGTVAGIAIGCLLAICLLLLLLLVLMRRRKQEKDTERPSDNFQNQTYAGEVTAAGPGLAYVNPQAESAAYLNPVLAVQLPAKSEEKLQENPYSECMDNENNDCAAAAAASDFSDDEMGYSKGVYEDIKLDMKELSDDSDDDFENGKTKTPSVEYLHARHAPAADNPAPIAVPPRNLFDEERGQMDNIYVPMETTQDPGPHYQ